MKDDFVGLPGLIARLAANDPTKAAVVTETEVLGYRDLNQRANRLARVLHRAGVGPGSLVGLWLDRSIEFVIGALAILKSGAAYVPLDPSYPEARLQFIAQDARLATVVTTARNGRGPWANTPQLRLIFLDEHAAAGQDATAQDAIDLAIHATADQIAYVIYTSGTTGQPKGVEITHGGLRNLMRWHTRAFGVTAEDRATLLANIGFDAAVWELWPHLGNGCTLYVPGAEIIRDPEGLRDWLVANGITVCFMPTLIASSLVRMAWPQKTRLRYMLAGGDTLHEYPRTDLPFQLINNYGPAECTVVATSGAVLPARDPGQVQSRDAGQPPSIGRAIDGAQIHLLDEQLREVTPGTLGEISIAGEGVGRGYLNRPELTREKFITIEVDGAPTRVYRTGDLGRMTADGSIQFLGRLDDQVKIRGYRIECGEVEAALNQLAGVRMSAVTARDYGAGDRRLVAYVVPEAAAEPTREELRQALKARLPEYMVPEEFVRLASLPITPNGKIDRRNLPAPSPATVFAEEEAYDNPIEGELIDILKKLLRVEQIGRDDNFFMLGGHSFIAAQVIARIRSHFDVNLSLRTVFDHPTPAGMASQIEQRVLAKMAAS